MSPGSSTPRRSRCTTTGRTPLSSPGSPASTRRRGSPTTRDWPRSPPGCTRRPATHSRRRATWRTQTRAVAAGPGAASSTPGVALVRAGDVRARCRADARRRRVGAAPSARGRPLAAVRRSLLAGHRAAPCSGTTERGDAILSRAVRAAERLGLDRDAASSRSRSARCSRPRAASAPGPTRCSALALAAMDDGGLQTYPTCALTLALSARSRLLCGTLSTPPPRSQTARRLAAGLTVALPWLAVQCRLELARAYVTVRDDAAPHGRS